IGSAAAQNGTLILNASSQGSLTVGPASVQVQRLVEVGTIAVNAGPLGTVTIFQGLPDVGSQMVLGPTGTTISVGPTVGGSVVAMNDESISLSWGMAPA